ncbi:hypothetical protein [Pontibacter ramchanderi]|uniref:YceI-like domain-containing protein n=1 Tax=Pontibacter ramchanderi TaxID=1179743 RepID=A0A2N3V2B3_9BACT|nr:hypothetical protein [Pontibacter ramchanderi]PKV75769.1 hypothetical protein BD749_0715 [Pontibacter ramchanderi]
MIKILLHVLLCFLVALPLQAQQYRIPYTANNSVQISLEGERSTYDFQSTRMLMRYDQNTRKLECLLPIDHLLPANDSSPVAMVQDIFFASRYPELYIEIEAPVEQINAGNRNRQTLNSRVFINIQGIIKEMVVPVTFTPDRNTITFSTSFELMLQDMRLRVPARYTSRLTGRMLFTIHSARWADLRNR